MDTLLTFKWSWIVITFKFVVLNLYKDQSGYNISALRREYYCQKYQKRMQNVAFHFFNVFTLIVCHNRFSNQKEHPRIFQKTWHTPASIWNFITLFDCSRNYFAWTWMVVQSYIPGCIPNPNWAPCGRSIWDNNVYRWNYHKNRWNGENYT